MAVWNGSHSNSPMVTLNETLAFWFAKLSNVNIRRFFLLFPFSLNPRYFFKGCSLGGHLFDHLLWSILVIITHITNYNLSHIGPLWAAFTYCIYTCLSDLWVLVIQLLIFIEKFSPLPGFEPGTSPVPS